MGRIIEKPRGRYWRFVLILDLVQSSNKSFFVVSRRRRYLGKQRGTKKEKSFLDSVHSRQGSMLLETLLVILLLGFSLIMLIASLISYVRVRNLRLLLVSGAFLIFLIESILLLVAVFIEDLWRDWGIPWHYVLLQLIAVVMFYFAVAKK